MTVPALSLPLLPHIFRSNKAKHSTVEAFTLLCLWTRCSFCLEGPWPPTPRAPAPLLSELPFILQNPAWTSPPPGKPFRPHDLITVSSTPLYFASLHCNYWFHQISSLPDLGLLQRWSCSGYSFCTPKLPFLSSKTELAPRLRLAQKPLFLPSASPVTPRGPSPMPFWCSGPTPRAGAHP